MFSYKNKINMLALLVTAPLISHCNFIHLKIHLSTPTSLPSLVGRNDLANVQLPSFNYLCAGASAKKSVN